MRILIADDNTLIRLGLSAALEGLDGVSEVLTAENGQVAVDMVTAAAAAVADGAQSEVEAGTDVGTDVGIDIVLLDVRMPVLDGIGALPRLLEHTKVVMLTHTEDVETVAQAMSLGASGYIVHGSLEPEAILAAIHTCLAGGMITAGLAPWERLVPGPSRPEPRSDMNLSVREAEIMEIISTGLANHQIARQLFLSEKTIKNHVNAIFGKLGVNSRAQAIAVWLGTAHGPVGPAEVGPELGPERVVHPVPGS